MTNCGTCIGVYAAKQNGMMISWQCVFQALSMLALCPYSIFVLPVNNDWQTVEHMFVYTSPVSGCTRAPNNSCEGQYGALCTRLQENTVHYVRVYRVAWYTMFTFTDTRHETYLGFPKVFIGDGRCTFVPAFIFLNAVKSRVVA